MVRRLTRPRRGMALATTLLALVVIAALIAGAFFASSQEYRIGRNTLTSQRAFAIAEFGLNSEIANWDRGRFLPGSSSFMAPGTVDSTRRAVADGDTAKIRVSRLNDNTFWVVSEGGASMDQALVRARQRTSALVRIAYPSVNVRGALTTAGRVDVNGSAKIYGNDMSGSTTPQISAAFNSLKQWGQCSSIGTDNKAGISMPPDTSLKEKANAISGTPSVERNAAAAAESTYIKFGDETWLSLAANADIPLAGGQTYSPAPVGTATTCDYTKTNGNLGEPWRAGEKFGQVAGCTGYFPIVYVNGDAHFNGGRGQGILMVNGDLIMNGGFQWYGLILVKSTIRSNGTADVFGAVMSEAAKLDDNNNSTTINGDQNIFYSKCAVESALRGSAILVPVRDRAWAQFF